MFSEERLRLGHMTLLLPVAHHPEMRPQKALSCGFCRTFLVYFTCWVGCFPRDSVVLHLLLAFHIILCVSPLFLPTTVCIYRLSILHPLPSGVGGSGAAARSVHNTREEKGTCSSHTIRGGNRLSKNYRLEKKTVFSKSIC